MTSPQPPAHRPRKDGRWPLQRPTLPPGVSDGRGFRVTPNPCWSLRVEWSAAAELTGPVPDLAMASVHNSRPMSILTGVNLTNLNQMSGFALVPHCQSQLIEADPVQ